MTFKVEEQNRNQFTFGGGVSGLEGAFINASFSTTNFLGAGETFQVYAQTGKRTKNYSLSVNEPYFMDRPITAGVDLFKRSTTYLPYYNVTGYTQDNTGVSLVSGFLVGKWSRAFLNYTYEIIDVSEAKIDPNDPYYQQQQLLTGGYGVGYASGSSYDPLLYGDLAKRRESRVTPNLVYNTVDNPYTPRAGMRHTLTMTFAGGPLGGTVDYLRPSVELVRYQPVGKKMSLGLRAQAAWIMTVRRHQGAAVLPALLPRWRDADPRLRDPLDRPDRQLRPSGRRHQVRPVQRRVLLRRVRAAARAALLRRGAGLPRGREDHA